MNPMGTKDDYRDRIYRYYVNARQQSITPNSVEELEGRRHLLESIIRDFFPKDRHAKIVDLGCGHGAFVYFIRKAGYMNVTGIDRSPEQVEAAKQLNIEGIREGDLLEELSSLPNESQDVVIAFDVIEHFTKEELLFFIDQVYRVLKRNGIWVIHAPNGESPFVSRIYHGDFTHETAFTRTSISQILLASDFAQVICREDVPIVHGVKSLVRFLLWKAIRGIWRLYLMVETGAGDGDCIFSQNFLTVARKG